MIKTNTLLFMLAALVMAVSHYFLLEFYLYWRYLWLDIPMHILGGSVVALGYLSLRDFFPNLPEHWTRWSIVILIVILIAVLWEIFEVIIGVAFDENRYVMDTIGDLACGVLGGYIGYFVGSRVRDTNL